MTHDHFLPLFCQASTIGIVGALGVAGLIAGAGHCVGMCGPFVIAQVPVTAGGAPVARLIRGAALPYHLGRATTYAGLGALAGGAAETVGRLAASPWLASGLLLAAAALLLTQSLAGLGLLAPWRAPAAAARLGAVLGRLARPLLATGFLRGYGLGLMLGFLPCGLIYSALLAAAGTGSADGGAAAMASFAAGTMPSLILLSCGATMLAARWRAMARRIAPPLQAATACGLAWLALT